MNLTDNEMNIALLIDWCNKKCKGCENRCDGCSANAVKQLIVYAHQQKTEIERLQSDNVKLHIIIPKMFAEAKTEAIKEFADKITEIFMRYAHLHNYAEQARVAEIEAPDGTKMELFSVWDVLTLKKHEMAEYEEMNELQQNIETIANDRLLTEVEKDFRLLVEEMVGD